VTTLPVAIDQQKLTKEFIFTGRGTVAQLMSDMGRVAILEKQLRTMVLLLRWLALAVFLLLGAAAVAVGKSPLMLILGGIAAIGIFVYSRVVASRIIHDRVEFLRLMLNMLSQDSDKKGRFQVLLQLHSKREKLSEGPNPHGGGTLNLFRDAWLSLGGRLSDGTSVSASCADLIRQRVRKNPRGKTKTKERRACLLRIQLDYNSAHYGDAAAAARGIEEPFRLPYGAEMKAFTFAPGQALVMKTVVKEDPVAVNLHAAGEAMMLGAYRILNLSRQRAMAGSGK
jgi:hypothetical protein